MTTPTMLVLARLQAAGHDPKQTRKGWSCRCPAHEDRNASLSIGTGDDGRVLLTCHAGCPFDSIVAALGIDPRDTFAESGPVGRRQPAATKTPTTFSTWEQAVSSIAGRRGPPARVWHYHDVAGEVVGVVARWARPGGGKDVRPVARQADGAWAAAGMVTPRPVYGLPAVLQAAGMVYVTEGEKAADAVRSLDLTCTTSAHGAQAASGTDWSPLAGRDVVVLPDRDDPGERYAADVVRLATAAGAASVRVVRLVDAWPAMPAGGDAFDWIEAHDATEPADLRATIERLVVDVQPAPIEAAAVAVAAVDSPADLLEWEPFPVALLPEPAGSFVAETAAGLGADPSLVALPMLASVAAMIGNRRRIEIWPGWQEPAIVWAAAVCDSGSMKSPAADKVLRFVRERQKAAMADHRAALAEWEQAKREHDAAKRSRSAAADAPPERPQAERLVIDDLTIEALAPILAANPRGVLLDRDELSGWIEGFDRYAPGGRGGAEVGRWLSVYNAGPITVDRKLSGTVYVPAALVSIFGGIQPRILARAAGQRHFDNGLVPRFILAAPPRRRKTLPGDGAGFATEAATADMFSTLAALPPGPDGGPEVLDLEPEALAEYRAYWQALAVEQFDATGPEASMLSKAEAWAARLALVCHLIRQAGSEPALRSRIDVDSIRRGIGLARWASREWRRVFAALEAGGVGSDDRALREWIAARGGVASPRDVARGLSQYRGPGRAEAALQRLAKGGAAEWVASATGGRPADAVRLK
jgi:hypothetical protein